MRFDGLIACSTVTLAATDGSSSDKKWLVLVKIRVVRFWRPGDCVCVKHAVTQ